MKLNYSQLESHLAQQLAPIYIVSSDDMILKQEALHSIRKAAKQAGYSERLRITPDAQFNAEKLYALLNAPSLLPVQQLIEIDLREHLPDKTTSSILQEYAARPSQLQIVILDMAKIESKTAKSAWLTALEKTGILLTLWPLSANELPDWIMKRARRYQLNLTREPAALLAQYVEGNLVAAAQAIEKLYLLRPEKIDAEVIQSIFADDSRFSLFDFIEYLLLADKNRVFHILDTLKHEGTEPILILWAITRELRLLFELARELAAGVPLKSLFEKNRIFFRRQQAVRRFLEKHTTKDCEQLLSQALTIDRVLKGGLPGDTWEALQVFCLRFL